jgi:Arc/MetJ-type ribon-helix-helix transcriptional regulator
MAESIRVSLPPALREWLRGQVRRKGYGSAEEYLGGLLRHDQLREARDRVDAELLKALDSGEPAPLTRSDWQRIRTEGRKRAAARRRARG